jgi:acylphosphatase
MSVPEGPEARRFLIRGRVQGVGFRYFVVEEARTLGLTGFTRNLPDGNVEVQAAGGGAALDELARALGQGPALSRVDGVTHENLEPAPNWTEFRITY